MAAAGAAAAGAAARRMLELEEEAMTKYTPDDLENDWEFKIVRANTMAFRKPETLRKLVEEESQAGWVMLEKFDDSRVRFKRRRSARANDANLPADYDPYRTHYGISTLLFVILLVGGILVATFLLIVVINVIVSALAQR